MFNATRIAARRVAPAGARFKSFTADEAWQMAHREIAIGTALGVVTGVIWMGGASVETSAIKRWYKTHNPDLSKK